MKRLICTSLVFSLMLITASTCKPRKSSRSGVSSADYDDPRNFNQRIAQNDRLRQVHWKLVFHQIFAKNMLLMNDPAQSGFATEDREGLLRRFVYFHPRNVNDSYETIVAAGTAARNSQTDPKTENEAYVAATASELSDTKIFGQYLSDQAFQAYLDRYFGKSPHAKVKRILAYYKSTSKAGSYSGQDYWQLPIGRMMDELLDGWVFILVPGFGSHNMDGRIFPEMVHEGTGRGLSILHPSPSDMGNTFTTDTAVAQNMLKWLSTKLAQGAINQNSKIALVGYSKGAPCVEEALRLAKAAAKSAAPGSIETIVANRTFVIATLAGVVQGTPIASDGLATVNGELSHLPDPAKQFLDMFDLAGMQLNPFALLAQRDKLGAFLKSIESLGLKQGAVSNILNRLSGINWDQLVQGVDDMTPAKRSQWNNNYLNDASLGSADHQLTIFNVSAITNVDDFSIPGPNQTPERYLQAPTLLPQFVGDGQIVQPDWRRFSIDDLFLWVTSVDSFNKIPARLFDTQVPLMSTKSPPLDRTSGSGVNANQIDFVDLGEVRHSHWFPIAKVFDPAQLLEGVSDTYTSPFPRSAFLASLIETIALYQSYSE